MKKNALGNIKKELLTSGPDIDKKRVEIVDTNKFII